MTVVAKLNYLRIAPRKVRLVADLIRGKSIQEAETVLNFTVKKSTFPLIKLLRQARANAQNNFQLDAANLYISKITVDEGPKLKRWRPRARGQAYEIQKKTSHVTIVLEEKVKTERKIKKSKPAAKKIADKEAAKEKITKKDKPKPKARIEMARPKTEKGTVKKMFRRKSF